MADPLPDDVRDAAVEWARDQRRTDRDDRIQHLAERRAHLLAEYGYTSRIREEDAGTYLVCYPTEWVRDGTIQPNAIEDLSDAVEVQLEGVGDPDDWAALAKRNRAAAARVEGDHGPIHGANARAFAAFMNNHRARRIENATEADFVEFRTEYYVRNVWPTESEAANVQKSLDLVCAAADADRQPQT